MSFLEEKIIPYKGLESFQFGDTLESVRALLKSKHIPFYQGLDEKNDKRPELKEEHVKFCDGISLHFVDGILFEIVVENCFQGQLPNGICVGMNMDDVNRIDADLQYNDDEEAFISQHGYLIIDDIDSNTISLIEIYIPEVENAKEFFKYEWMERYR